LEVDRLLLSHHHHHKTHTVRNDPSGKSGTDEDK
jgi:hypothetical protein